MILTCLRKGIREIVIKIQIRDTHRVLLYQELKQIQPLPLRRLGPISLQITVLLVCQEAIVCPAVQGVDLLEVL